MMKPVLQYTDFRIFLRDYYATRKLSGFTYREFSRIAGYTSPVFMKLVIDGKANLSPAGTERVGVATGLIGSDLEYFRAMVAMNQSKDAGKKKFFFEKMRKIARANQVKILGEEQYDYYQSWLSPVLREALPHLTPTSKTSDIAEKLLFKANASEIRSAIQILLDTGLLDKDADGNFSQTEKLLSTGDLEIPSLAVREMHRQMGNLGVKALDEIPVEDRDISGMTLGVTENALPRIRAEIAEFRRRIAKISSKSPNTDKVYRLNIQFFPLTHSLNDEKGERK